MRQNKSANGVQFTNANIRVIAEEHGWVRAILGEDAEFGDVLFDFSGANEPEDRDTQDGSPRIVIHEPAGDAIIYIRLHGDRLIVTPNSGVSVDIVDGRFEFKF